MESQYFIFDGIPSSEMDLYIMRIDHSGFVETPYWGSSKIREERLSKRLSPYLYGVDRDPIEFTVQFVLADSNFQPKIWTPQERYKIAKWLIHDTYKEFQTSDDLDKRYYAIVISDTDLNLINSQGYIEVKFRTNSPFAWTDVETKEFDLSSNTTSTTIQIENKSNVVAIYKPKIEIQMMGDTSVTLKNLSNNSTEFKFVDLRTNELVSIDNENELVLSNYPININPFDNFNREWLELVQGINEIEVFGRCKLWIKTQFPIAQ